MESDGESSTYSCPKVVTHNPEHLPACRAALTKTSENFRLLKVFFFQENIFLKEYSVSPYTRYFLKTHIYLLKTTILNKTRKHTERQKFQEDMALAQQYQLLCDSSQRTHTFPPPLQTSYESSVQVMQGIFFYTTTTTWHKKHKTHLKFCFQNALTHKSIFN